MSTPSTVVVVIIGFGLVLAILFILILILGLEGKIFSSIDKRNATAKKNNPVEEIKQPVAEIVPVIEQGVPEEVVAAIVAALSCMENGRFELRSITKAKTNRSSWNLSGTVSYQDLF